MDELTSTEFRKRYASLTEPTFVTVNGHVIGQWLPNGFLPAAIEEYGDDVLDTRAPHNVTEAFMPHKPTFTPQKQRDELLRRINRR